MKKNFCVDDLPKHRKNLHEDLGQIQNEFRETTNEQRSNPRKHSWMKQVNQLRKLNK